MKEKPARRAGKAGVRRPGQAACRHLARAGAARRCGCACPQTSVRARNVVGAASTKPTENATGSRAWPLQERNGESFVNHDKERMAVRADRLRIAADGEAEQR